MKYIILGRTPTLNEIYKAALDTWVRNQINVHHYIQPKQSHSVRIFGGEKFCNSLKSSLSEVEREQLKQEARLSKPFTAAKTLYNYMFEPKKKHKPKGHQPPYKFHR